MVKFLATSDEGRKIVGLILSGDNLERLRAGKPLHVHLEELGLPWHGELVVAFGGETEQDLLAFAREQFGREPTERTAVDA